MLGSNLFFCEKCIANVSFVTPQRRFRVPIYVWNDIPWTFYPNLWDNEIIGFSAQVGKIEEVPHGFRVFFLEALLDMVIFFWGGGVISS